MFLSFNKIARGIYLIPTRYDKKCAMFDGRRPYAPLDPVEGSKSEPTQPACNDGSTAASQSKKGSSESVKLLSCFPKTYSSGEQVRIIGFSDDLFSGAVFCHNNVTCYLSLEATRINLVHNC